MTEPASPGTELAQRLGAMGLPVGLVVGGWTLAGVASAHSAAVLAFVQGRSRVEVQLQPSSPGNRYFARIGDLDLSHLPVEDSLTRRAGDLTKAVAERLGRHVRQAARAPGAELRSLLAAPAESAPASPAEASGAYASETEAPDLDPARQTPPDRPFMRFVEIDAGEVWRFPDALRQMYDGTLGGLVIKNVYSRAAVAAVMERLADADGDFPRTSFPPRFKAHFYGRCLDGADPELDEYLRDAARFRAQLEGTFAASPPFEARMEEVFRALAGGRAVELPRYTDGRAYTPATIRILLDGGQIGTHCGNEAATRPAYTHLNRTIDRHDQLSYFLTLQDGAAGGELIVYSLQWSHVDASAIVGGRSQVDALLGAAEWMAVSPGPGDLLIFDGGRYFHRVNRVAGGRPRFTIGGFLMFSAAGETLYYWS